MPFLNWLLSNNFLYWLASGLNFVLLVDDPMVYRGGQRFYTKDIDGFYLGHKKENNICMILVGEQVVVTRGLTVI